MCNYIQDFRDRWEPFQTILIHIVIKYVCSTSELPEVTWSLAIATFSTISSKYVQNLNELTIVSGGLKLRVLESYIQ